MIVYTREDFLERVKDLTHGRGVDVVYDSVGKLTVPKSLDCLTPRGMLVSYGNASGKPDPIDPLTLSRKGSLFLTRPTLGHYTATREELEASAHALFRGVRGGTRRGSHRPAFPARARRRGAPRARVARHRLAPRCWWFDRCKPAHAHSPSSSCCRRGRHAPPRPAEVNSAGPHLRAASRRMPSPDADPRTHTRRPPLVVVGGGTRPAPRKWNSGGAPPRRPLRGGSSPDADPRTHTRRPPL